MRPLFAFVVLCSSSALGADWIVPGTAWTDMDGNKIDAHGGGVFKRDDTFYWIGHGAANQTPMLYSSADLLNWKNLGPQAAITGLWRPKIAKPNDKFWIFGQQDRYVRSLMSADLAGGRYTAAAKVHLPPSDYTYSDTGMFYDEASSTWHLLTSADHNTLQINKINPDGTVGDRVLAFTKGAYEAPGIFVENGTYYLVVSGKTGWRANPNKVFWATSLAGPWSGGTDIAPPDEKTYGSQNTFELTLRGTRATTHVYMGDAWDAKGGPASNYVWLPIKNKQPTLDYRPMWKLDVRTGEVSYPKTKQYYAADVVGPGQNFTFRNITGTGAPEWLTLHYSVNDAAAGDALIYVNDDASPTNVSTLNSCAGHADAVSVRVKLQAGAVNIVRLGALGHPGFKVFVYGLEVHE
ncbi:carbohydrate-binding module family 35 protein [Echria macrotheca]|uniref:Carbohydrate-binding module family 35 protein n=1 Tax=Echria macrotheca TaxID=438768 RepID=A0AAJ0BL48_9PEZI|nr:carbohydrate-binding module family 35 protein [Echria macrotheca]